MSTLVEMSLTKVNNDTKKGRKRAKKVEKEPENKGPTRYQRQKRQLLQALKNREILIKPSMTKKVFKSSLSSHKTRVSNSAAIVTSAALEQYLNQIIGVGLDLATDVSKRTSAGLKPQDVIKAFMILSPTTGLNVTDIGQAYTLNESPSVSRKKD